MLSPGDTKPGADRSEAGDNLFRALCRLVPNSGIQFLDISIPRHALDTVVRTFVETRVKVGDETVWALASPQSTSGDGEPSASDGVLRVSGRTAFQAVVDRWIPLPYLRFVARDGRGRARFDQGPFNWARLYVSSAAKEHSDAYAAVIAFDTRTDPSSRLDLASYIMPTEDDVRFASTFAMPDDAEELAPLLAEPWLQDWIAGTFPQVQAPLPGGAPQALGLQKIACYLTLLTVLSRAGVVPSLQFFDTTRDAVEPMPVDIVIDIGTSRSAAMLVESSGGRPDLSGARLLELRDLADPTRRFEGAFESRIAFSRASFGSEVLSRRSGRADAFEWPSLARTGTEAARLAARSQAADGAVGITEPKSHLRDLTPRSDTWRFAPDVRTGLKRGQMISGRLLSQAGPTAGLLPGPPGAVKTVALRPHHALTTMTSFLIAELLQQTLCAINAPAMAGATEASDAVRQLRQIILPVPLTMPLDERDLLRERADAAVDMVWSALDWHKNGNDASTSGAASASRNVPPKPVVRLGLDETLAAQLVYLYDEIAHRFRGDARSLLDVMGKNRPEFGVQPSLRFGAIDIGGGHATMTIVTYAASGDTPISPNLLGAQRSKIAGTTLLDGIATALVLPHLADAVADAGGEKSLPFLETLLQPLAGTFDPAAVGTRLSEYWLRPAALSLLQMATGLPSNALAQTVTLTLGDLVAMQGPQNASISRELSTAIEAIRAAPVDLQAVRLVVRLSDVVAMARVILEPMITSLARALVASDCDAVLLTGWAARLTVVRALLIEQMPWRPDRIVVLANHAWQSWYPMSEQHRAAAGGKDVALVGALLALAGGERLGFGDGGSFAFGSGLDSRDLDGKDQSAGDGWRSAAVPPAGASP
jgi:hypothetical protein